MSYSPSGIDAAIALLGIGILVLALRRDLILKLLGLGLINSSTILFLVSIRFTPDAAIPILPVRDAGIVADPLPQAVVLSAIVINFAILALALVFVMILVERYHTTDSERIESEVAAEQGGEG
ncbi:Na+/H+ antiporter subunit C [Candidatus Acetothermia bacterium]|nr:MAG: Na+/H+ antiporter subunit C [Candidatus Acetothermia bacterium]